MSWRRLPTFFPNFPLRLLPLSEAQKTALQATGHVEEAVFRTVPSIGKVGLKGVEWAWWFPGWQVTGTFPPSGGWAQCRQQ